MNTIISLNFLKNNYLFLFFDQSIALFHFSFMDSLDCSMGAFLETGESPVTFKPSIKIPNAASINNNVNLIRVRRLDPFYLTLLFSHQPIDFV